MPVDMLHLSHSTAFKCNAHYKIHIVALEFHLVTRHGRSLGRSELVQNDRLRVFEFGFCRKHFTVRGFESDFPHFRSFCRKHDTDFALLSG